MANQITVTSGTGNITVTTSRSVIGTLANVASANLANYVIQNSQPNITSVGTMTGLTSSGNITAPFFIGNVVGNISGNLVVPGTNTAVLFNQQGNAGASDALTFNYSSNVLTANGNIVANFFIGNGSQLTGVTAVDSNHANVADVANSVAVANVVGIGNIAVLNLSGSTSNVLYGNGVFAPIVAGDANYANFAGDVVNSSQPNITSLGTLTGLVVGGDITPNSNVTHSLGNNTNRFNDLYLAGNTIYLGAQEISSNATNVSFTGILSGNANGLTSINGSNVTGTVPYASVANSVAGSNVTGQVAYAATANSVAGANVSGAVAYATTANAVAGANVSGQVAYAAVANSIAGANVTGQVNYAATANSVAVANVSGIGNIATVNLDGNVSNLLTGAGTFVAIPTGGGNTANANYANFAGNVVNASQPNITSVGTLTTLAVSGNATIGNITSVDSVTFDTANVGPGAVAQLTWNDGQGTLDLGLKGGNVTATVAQQQYARVYNAEANSLSKGEVVYVSGAQGNLIKVNRAQANTEATSVGTLGVVAETITTGGEGFIQTTGAMYKLNTNGLTAGNVLYLSPSTPGGYTQTKPVAPDQLVTLGYVERVSATVGSIYVKIDNGYELDELHNVLITSPTSGQALVYNGSNLWINGNPNIANIANTVSDNAQPNITSTGNLVYLNVRDDSNANSVITQFVPNTIPIWTNSPTSNAAYNVTTQYWPNASTGYPTPVIIRSRGDATTPTTAVSGDRVSSDRFMVYNGNANVLVGAETWTLVNGGTLSNAANQAVAGGQWNLLTINPSGSNLANSTAQDAQNSLVFTNSGSLQIFPGTPANTSLGQSQSAIVITNYGTSTTDLVRAGGILQQRGRGNRDSVASVQPGDQVGRILYGAYNGTSYDNANSSQYRVVVDSSYVAGESIVPQNHQIQTVANVGGVATFKITTFYGNGLVNLPDGLEVTGNVFAPAIVQNASSYDTRVSLNSAAGIVEITSAGNSTQFAPSGVITLGGASQIIGGTFGGSGITLGASQTDIFQNRSGNVTVQVGNSGTISSIWNFNNDGNLVLPGNTFAVNYANGTQVSIGGGGTPGGNTTELQYNNAGSFGGMANVTYDGSNLSLGDISTVKISGGTANDFIKTDGAGNLSFGGIATNLIVGTRISPVTILISNYQMNVLARTGNVVVYVN